MRWERFIRNCAFAIILFLLVQALEAARLPATEGVREYLAYAFTADWDYHPTLEQARRGAHTLATYSGRFRSPQPGGEAPAPPLSLSVRPGDLPASGSGAASAVSGSSPAGASRPTPSPPPAPAPAPATLRLAWPVQGWVSERFGRRTHPIYRLVGPHEGIDIAAAEGTPVTAPAAGEVTATFRGLTSGLTVDLAHDGFTTRFAHLSAFKVRPGQQVASGTVIGLVGSTGVATGPHLHFEVRIAGRPVDPLPLLPR